MAKHLAKLAERVPKLYAFTPKSYQLPEETADFLADAKVVRKGKAWIIKPDAGCQGRGIVLVQKSKQIENVCPPPAGAFPECVRPISNLLSIGTLTYSSVSCSVRSPLPMKRSSRY